MRKILRDQLEELLRDWYKRKISSPLKRKRPKLEGTVFDLQPEVSSQETTQIVVEIEPLMGFRVKTGDVIKPGGYRNIEEFVEYTLPRLQRQFELRGRGVASAASHRGGEVSASIR